MPGNFIKEIDGATAMGVEGSGHRLGGITKSMRTMTRATESLAGGNFDTVAKVNRSDKLGRLAHSINHPAARPDHFVNGQRRFSGNMAHELCSPPGRMQLATSLLERGGDAAHRERMADVQEEVEIMTHLVNELLSFSKAGLRARDTPMESVPLAPLVRDVIRREAGGDRVECELPETLTALAESELISRAVANLVRNALRYAGPAGKVNVDGRALDGQVLLTVSEHGPGVPEEELERIFEPFYGPDTARTREMGGSGPGLAVVRTCVKACQGSVMAANNVPSGLSVTIRVTAAGGTGSAFAEGSGETGNARSRALTPENFPPSLTLMILPSDGDPPPRRKDDKKDGSAPQEPEMAAWWDENAGGGGGEDDDDEEEDEADDDAEDDDDLPEHESVLKSVAGPGWREELVRELAESLADLSEIEDPDEEYDPPEPPDLYTFFGELAALRNELRRGTRRAGDAVVKTAEALDSVQVLLKTMAPGNKKPGLPTSAGGGRAWNVESCLSLVALHDLFQQSCPGDAANASFGPLLKAAGLTRIPTVGKLFDPAGMTVAGVESATDGSATDGNTAGTGRVVKEIDAGFLRDGVLLRPARVCIRQLPEESPPENPPPGNS